MKNQIPPNTSGGLGSLPPAAQEELIRISEIWRFEQKDVVLEADEYSEHVYFIATGSLLSYVERGGENIVKWVRATGDFAFAQNTENATPSLQKQLTGQIIIALEETNVIKISFEALNRLQDKYPQIDDVVTHHVNESAMIEQWLQACKNLPPKRKYEVVQAEVGFQLSKVPDVYLASWLGITLGELRDVRSSIQ